MLLNYQEKKATFDEVDQKFDNIFVLHGLFGSLSNLAGVTGTLQKHHNVISVDLRNHGDSPHCSSMSYQEMAEDLFELADHLSIDNFSIIGHSMGGKVAMTCALRHPERVNKLLVADIAPVVYENHHQDILNGLQTLISQPIKDRQAADLHLSKYIQTPGIRQFLLKSLHKKEGKYQIKFNLQSIIKNYDSIRGWPETNKVFNKPTLFIKGGDSDYIRNEHQTEIVRLFPQAKAKVINDTGHWLHIEKAKTFNRLVTQFFK